MYKIVLVLAVVNVIFSSVSVANSPESIFESAKAYTVKIKTSVSLPFNDDIKGTWSGAGFVVDSQNKWIVTNAHVASRSPAIISVSSYGREMIPAKAVYIDPVFDVAILEAPKLKGVKNAPIDCTNPAVIGLAVGAFGHPGNYNYTGTKGIISGRTSDLVLFGDYLQTDASINPGNSGGPLISLTSGKIVGMNTASREKAQNMNWAVPTEQICSIVQLLREGRDPTPPIPAFDFYKDSEMKNTLRVARSTKKGTGFGIKRDDEIIAVKINNKIIKISNQAQLLNAVRGLSVAQLILKRDGKEKVVTGKFEPRKPVLQNRGLYFSGLMIRTLDVFEIGAIIGIEHPLIVDYIEPGSLAENTGIDAKDFVTSINGVDCNDLDQAYELIEKSNGELIKVRIQHIGPNNTEFFTFFERTLELQDLKWVVIKK